LYQDNGWVIAGENPIVAADPSQTVILGNWKFDYDQPPGADISVSELPFYKTAFRVAHSKMDRDPRVWELAEKLVRVACSGEDADLGEDIVMGEGLTDHHGLLFQDEISP
jgi:hypothetical protein